jgi:hypothetical protein
MQIETTPDAVSRIPRALLRTPSKAEGQMDLPQPVDADEAPDLLKRAIIPGSCTSTASPADVLATWLRARDASTDYAIIQFEMSAPVRFPATLGKENAGADRLWDGWFQKLEACLSLNPGWNGYTAQPPSRTAVEYARVLLSVMCREGYAPTRLAPSAMGGVAVTRKAGNRKVLVEFYNDGRAFALFSERGGDMRTTPVGTDRMAFLALLRQMREYLDG